MKLIRKIAESSSQRAFFRAMGRRNFRAPSEDFFMQNCANKDFHYNTAVYPIASPKRMLNRRNLYGDTMLDRVNLGRDTLHSRILGTMSGRRMQDAFFLHSETKTMDDLCSAGWNPVTLRHTRPSDVYPSFCLRFFIEPCCSESLIESEPDVAAEDDPGVLRADSVKKKRKRKMNKHKLRKQRRLLRRKSH